MPTRKESRLLGLLQRTGSSGAALKRLRSAGDRARDDGDWATAVDHYRDFLKGVPDDTAIWVQYGHALKELNRPIDAETAYATAAKLDPLDADARLHLGFLLKKQNRGMNAADMFLEALKIAPNAQIIRELNDAGYGFHTSSIFQHRPSELVAGSILIELKDFFQYLNSHTTVTGITRVTLGLIHFILNEMDQEEARRYQFVHQYGDDIGMILISKENIRAVVAAALSPDVSLAAMQALIVEIRASSMLFRPATGDTYLIVGAFWEFVANPSWISGMRQRGIVIGAYIYDLIPITHANYCMQELTDAFTLAFAETARLLDFALTISAFVAQEVENYLRSHAIPVFPIVPVPLAHSLHIDVSEKVVAGSSTSTRHYLSGIPFVLCVCTIEARKNHVYLFDIWSRMIDEGLDVPDLVFVGRPGWRVETLIKRIEDSNHLDGRVHILYGLTDNELADLYDRCLFTAFPSFVEGWGLPVGESLAHGKLCVASSASSIPEVGGDQVIYIDPLDVDDGYVTITGLLADTDRIRDRENDLRTSFRPRTWSDVGRDFFAKTEGLVAHARETIDARPSFAPLLPAARLLETAKLARAAMHVDAYVANPERLAFAIGWRHVERTGIWMLDPQAVVIVQTDCSPGASVAVLLHLSTSPWVRAHNVLTVSAGSVGPAQRYRRPLKPDNASWIEVEGRTDDRGRLVIALEVEGDVRAPAGNVPVGVRVLALGYAASNDAERRIGLLRRALIR